MGRYLRKERRSLENCFAVSVESNVSEQHECSGESSVSEQPESIDSSAHSSEQSDRDSEPSRDALFQEIDSLRAERDEAIQNVGIIKAKISKIALSSSAVINDNASCKFYTGLTWETFNVIFTYLSPFVQYKTKDSMPFIDQFFVTLVRLRQDLSFEMISKLTGYGKSTIQEYFWKWVNVAFIKLRHLIRWPDHEANMKTIPVEFRQKYGRLKAIIDCTEIFIGQPSDLKARAQTYSNYKRHTTAKILIACTPLGSISYISHAWGGRVSDIELVRKSGFISNERFFPGDQILADRGFPLHDDFAVNCGAELVVPSWTKGKKQLSAYECTYSRDRSNVRIHIERVIGLLKNRYTILRGTIPITVIKSLKEESQNASLASIDRILQVCGALCNLRESIVRKHP